jgi:phage-related baseplate assembly protein
MTIDELTTPATVEEMRDAIYAAIAAQGLTTTTWKPGAVVRTIVAGLAVVLSAFSQLAALVTKSGFLELAEDDWLTLVAHFVYGVDRDAGAFATGAVNVSNASGNVYSGGPGDLVFSNPTTGKTYRNTQSYTIGAGASGVSLPIQAIEIGTASSSASAAITALVTTLLGVTVTNPIAVIGRDPELDPALRARCYEKTGTLSPAGPSDAYSFVAKGAKRTDESAIGVTRVRSIPDGSGGLAVYIANASGAIVDSGDIAAVQAAIDKQVAPLAITPNVSSASNKTVAVTYELWLLDTTGKTNTEIQAAIAAKLTSYVQAQPIGGYTIPPASGKVYVSAIEALIGGTFPAQTIRVDVTVPAADVAIGASEVPVIGAITATIHQVAGGSL